MDKVIKIGTRSSKLATWQAETVAGMLQNKGHETEIVKIDTLGDQDQNKPLYELGITGVFTKNLDIALLNNKIDIAVNSFKDVPTILPKHIIQAAVLQRGNYNDTIIFKNSYNSISKKSAVIATGSLRRKAQWLNRYPHHQITGLRGNVNTRLRKLEENNWDGAIFAFAGLDRINVLPEKHAVLNWMIPAPAQGAIMIAALETNTEILEVCREINHFETELCTGIEREFLRILEGGCSAPIGALATIEDDIVNFTGIVLSPDGKEKIEYKTKRKISKAKDLGKTAAQEIIARGGRRIIRLSLNPEKISLISTKLLSKKQTELLPSNIEIFMHDFIKTESIPIQFKNLKDSLKHVVFTSRNAVKPLINNISKADLNFQNIYCVGNKTKQFIEKMIGPAPHSEDSAKELADFLVHQDIDKINYFCGASRRKELPDILQENNIEVKEIVTYRTILTPKKFTQNYDGVIFFSPSGVQSFILENKVANATAFCIGKTTAKEAQKHFKKIVISKNNDIESVIDIINKTYLN